MLFAFLMAGTVGTIAGGPLADRFGNKKIILLSLGLSAPLLLLFLLTSGVWPIIFFILIGFTLIISFSMAMVLGQTFMPHNLGMVSGLILGLAFGFGGVGAAVLGFFADHWGVPLTLWFIACLLFPAFILGTLIPETKKKEE